MRYYETFDVTWPSDNNQSGDVQLILFCKQRMYRKQRNRMQRSVSRTQSDVNEMTRADMCARFSGKRTAKYVMGGSDFQVKMTDSWSHRARTMRYMNKDCEESSPTQEEKHRTMIRLRRAPVSRSLRRFIWMVQRPSAQLHEQRLQRECTKSEKEHIKNSGQ